MNPFDDDQEQRETEALIKRFDEMLQLNKQYFFDASEFEEIIDSFLESRNISKAIKAGKMAVSQHPYTVSLQIKLAQMFAYTNDLVKAQEILNKARNQEPNNPEIFITQGGIFSQMGHAEKAIAAYKQALEVAQQKDDIYMFIALEYKTRDKFDSAKVYLKKALAENPDNEFAFYELAHCYQMTDRNEEAAAYFLAFIEEHPFSLACWTNLGMTYSRMGKLKESAEAFDYALAIDEQFTSAMFGKAQVFVDECNFTDAIAMYKQILELEPNDAFCLFLMAECYEKLDMFEVALTHYNLAIELESNYPDSWIGKAACHQALLQYSEGITAVRRAIELDKSNPDAWYIAGELYSTCGMMEEGENAYIESLKLDPDDLDTWLNYAEMFYSNNDTPKAIEILYEAVAMLKGHYAAKTRLAAHLYMTGKNKEADRLLFEAMDICYAAADELFHYNPSLKDNENALFVISQFPTNG